MFYVNTSSAPPKAHPYHHGDLRHALIEAAVELAREGGPRAIVLRETARRVGVSPNAAYRHFDSLPDLIAAVARVGLTQMAAVMQAELGQVVPSGDPAQDAAHRLMAVGRGYIRFALAEPGLFATAFTSPHETSGEFGALVDDTTPEGLLQERLDELVATGMLAPTDYDTLAKTCWALAHGLSTLLLGPMSGVPLDERPALIDACLGVLGRALAST